VESENTATKSNPIIISRKTQLYPTPEQKLLFEQWFSASRWAYNKAKEISRKTKLKRVDRRLQVIILRYEGKKDSEIAEKLNYTSKRVSQLCAEFKKVGAEEYARHKYGGNNQVVTTEKEKEILDKFRAKAEKGTIVMAQEIKAEFDKLLGRDTGSGYIYMLLKRHGWRMVMPRGKHPKKASDEDIEASKKLT
jgi:transposase